MSGREAIGARLRFEVLRRCNFACYYCGTPAAFGMKQLHVDHVVPVSLGGKNDPWNLVAACWDCNAGKANTMPTPELVRRVREDYVSSLRTDGRGRAIICVLCQRPYIHAEGDEAYTYCMPCVERDITVYELGFAKGSEVAG